MRLAIGAFLMCVGAVSNATPAFNGAQGYGAEAIGGRGGVICEVTNLNDSGDGSLRECVDMVGPRIVVFRVGGTINLLRNLSIINPYITIAGQTAPGGGILLSGKNNKNDIIDVFTNDVVIRYIRARKGYNAEAVQAGDSVGIAAGHDIIIDHCSFSWTTDENASVWGPGDANTPQPANITYSFNLMAEPLKSHPTNFITGSNNQMAGTMVGIDMHNNLLANSSHRNPLIKNKTFKFVNNIVYNWSYYATQVGAGSDVDVINNYYKGGPMYHATWGRGHEVEVFAKTQDNTPVGPPSLFIDGNIGPSNASPDADNWVMVNEIPSENKPEIGQLSLLYRRNEQLPNAKIPIEIKPARSLESSIIQDVGASKKLDCMGALLPNKDSVDNRIIGEYFSNKGIVPTTEEDVGGFPVIEGGIPCDDADHDGMPDIWEEANGLNKNDPSDGPVVGQYGFTNVEMYLNGNNVYSQLTTPRLVIQ